MPSFDRRFVTALRVPGTSLLPVDEKLRESAIGSVTQAVALLGLWHAGGGLAKAGRGVVVRPCRGSCLWRGPQGLTTEDTKDHGDARRRWAKAGGSTIRQCGGDVCRLRRQAARCPPLPWSRPFRGGFAWFAIGAHAILADAARHEPGKVSAPWITVVLHVLRG